MITTPEPVDEGLDRFAVTFTTALLGTSTWVGSFADVVARLRATLDAHVAAELEVEFTVSTRRVTRAETEVIDRALRRHHRR